MKIERMEVNEKNKEWRSLEKWPYLTSTFPIMLQGPIVYQTLPNVKGTDVRNDQLLDEMNGYAKSE
jgi:hypothetical protein